MTKVIYRGVEVGCYLSRAQANSIIENIWTTWGYDPRDFSLV